MIYNFSRRKCRHTGLYISCMCICVWICTHIYNYIGIYIVYSIPLHPILENIHYEKRILWLIHVHEMSQRKDNRKLGAKSTFPHLEPWICMCARLGGGGHSHWKEKAWEEMGESLSDSFGLPGFGKFRMSFLLNIFLT